MVLLARLPDPGKYLKVVGKIEFRHQARDPHSQETEKRGIFRGMVRRGGNKRRRRTEEREGLSCDRQLTCPLIIPQQQQQQLWLVLCVACSTAHRSSSEKEMMTIMNN